MRSRVIPGSSPTMERREPVRRLKSVDLPTLGRPTIAKIGAVAAVKADFFECRLRESFTGSSPKFLLLQSGMKAERPGDGAKAESRREDGHRHSRFPLRKAPSDQ